MDSTEIMKLIEAAIEKHFSKAEAIAKERFICLEQRFDSLQSDVSSLKEEIKVLRADNVVQSAQKKLSAHPVHCQNH